MGRLTDADHVIDRVRGLWPDDGFAIYARFLLFALTDRPAAARALLDSVPVFEGAIAKTWSIGLDALQLRTAAAIEAARAA